MECTNEQVATLLSDYFSGHLSTAETDTVRAHLATCQVCRESLHAMSLLAPQSAAGLKSHPSKDALAQYYRDRSSLTPVIAALLEKHLAECKECAAEMTILDDMEQELRTSVAGGEYSGGRIHALVRRYGQYVAYATAACLLISVGYRVLTTEDRDGGSTQVYQLTEATRAGNRAIEIPRAPGGQSVTFEVPFYHMRVDNEYTASVIGEQGKPISTEIERLSFPEPGRIRVQIRLSGLASGEYQLVIHESKRVATDQVSRSYYPFRLVAGN